MKWWGIIVKMYKFLFMKFMFVFKDRVLVYIYKIRNYIWINILVGFKKKKLNKVFRSLYVVIENKIWKIVIIYLNYF